MSRSYAPRHAHHRRPQPNANQPPRFRKTYEQNARREYQDSNGTNEEHHNHRHHNTYEPENLNDRHSYSRGNFSSAGNYQRFTQQGLRQYDDDRHYRKTHQNKETEVDHKVENGFRRRNRYPSGAKDTEDKGEALPAGAVSSASNAASSSAAGTVINGRYVRKSVLHSSSQLNADAPPFIPKSAGEQFDKNRNNRSSSRSKNGWKNMQEPRRGHSFSTSNSQSSHNFRKGSSNRSSSKQKPNKSLSRKNSEIDSEIASGSELCADGFEYDEHDPDSSVAGSERNMNKKAVDKDSSVHVSKNKESTTQRERLIWQLEKGECECLVCCEPIRVRDYVWSCNNCYHVFHLRCIKKWAGSPAAIIKDRIWRCPACQNANDNPPSHYYCFCGKRKEPDVNFHYTPHSCGEVCGKHRPDEQCMHTCTILCHPGPCPPCTAIVNRSCSCGKSQNMVPCLRNEPFTCSATCEKLLNCGVHKCEDTCHVGECKSCAVVVTQECFCGREEKTVLCTASVVGSPGYSCGMVCDKRLACGNHLCPSICHEGNCVTCSLLPEAVQTCPCGKTPLKEMVSDGKPVTRHSCVDPVPVCGKKCEKLLPCGPKGNCHKCSSECHLGGCPPCPLTTNVKCRCGSTHKEMPCVEMLKLPVAFQCEKRCNRRKDCGRHKCLNNCCINTVHKCELVCNKKLSCGLHQCQETCHAGNCPTCWNVSFDELRCHCGYSVRYPPIPCGARPPECNQPCIRSHPCDHKVQHACHSEETCPPCTILTAKWCFGQHEHRSNVQCFLDGISCGRHCNKQLPCGRHRCLEICHSGSCLKPNVSCTQPCELLRTCEHPCAAPCHDGPCPDTICRTKVEVSCPCGNRSEIVTCSEDANAINLMSYSTLASKIQDIKAGESVCMQGLFSRRGKTSKLQCNEACAVRERNKRLAVALQIQNPDLSCKPGPPAYSEFLKEEARKNMKFVCGVYDKITELVQLAKQSKQKSRSFAFPPMKRNQRRVVHELAEFFGCETQSYDEEPVKNVVVTAFREKSWLPFVSVAAVVEREMGHRRGPNPIVSLTTAKATSTAAANGAEKKEKVIDYFDYKE